MLLSLHVQEKQTAEASEQALAAKAHREKEALLQAEERRQVVERQRGQRVVFRSVLGPCDDSNFEEVANIAAAATEIGAVFGRTLRKHVPAQQWGQLCQEAARMVGGGQSEAG